ncbi:metallophosphoesterase [Brevibacillus thermoruber]|jgi:uncharacterized protein|uniref:metallophosphoesterase n=1 Tax=Brevibacillus thermoruber TaxID=33942 RepID=UPI004042F4A7
MTKGIHWLLGLLGVGALCGAYGYGWERHQLEVVSLPVSLPDWPQALKGVRMVHFSDTHLGPYWGIEELRRVVDLINREKPDLICFTGDLVDKSTRLLSAAVPVLRALQAPLGKFAVLGNHDWRYGQQAVIHQALLDAEFQVLNNRHVRTEHKGAGLYVAGVDDVLHGTPDLAGALAGIPAGEPVILLVHEPDFADEAARYPVHLQLSGHSHGGQVRLPLIGHLATPELGQKYVSGLMQAGERGMPVYTNRGLGTTILPVRFLCRPEVTVLTLV